MDTIRLLTVFLRSRITAAHLSLEVADANIGLSDELIIHNCCGLSRDWASCGKMQFIRDPVR